MKELVAGQLYQVRNANKWMIAEYVRPVPAHSYKYNNIYLEPTIEVGPEKVRHVPDMHSWRYIRANGGGSYFNVPDRGLEIRPVTPDALATIAQLKQEIVEAEKNWIAKKKELREFCE